MYSASKFSLYLSMALTGFCFGMTVHGFGNNLETYLQAGATIFLAAMFYIRLGWYRSNVYEEVTPDIITDDMLDPYAQVALLAFQSGQPVTHNGGDDFMTTYDKEGNASKVKLKE